jgi:hypothetical protein
MRGGGKRGVFGNWRVSSSLIRNLEDVFWFGTLRVLEEDRKTGNREQGIRKRALDLILASALEFFSLKTEN